MNKKQFAKIYREMNSKEITLKEVENEVNRFLETLQEALLKDGEVKFVEKGIFEIFSRNQRVISNPSTRELMTIYPKKTVKFRMSKKIFK